jgi:hypothetical protein
MAAGIRLRSTPLNKYEREFYLRMTRRMGRTRRGLSSHWL